MDFNTVAKPSAGLVASSSTWETALAISVTRRHMCIAVLSRWAQRYLPRTLSITPCFGESMAGSGSSLGYFLTWSRYMAARAKEVIALHGKVSTQYALEDSQTLNSGPATPL